MRALIMDLHEHALDLAPKVLAVGVPASAVSPYDLPVVLEFGPPSPRNNFLTFSLVTYRDDRRVVHKSGALRPDGTMLGGLRFWTMVESREIWLRHVDGSVLGPEFLRDTNALDESVIAYDDAVELLADIGRAIVLDGGTWAWGNSTRVESVPVVGVDAVLDKPGNRELLRKIVASYHAHVERTGMHGLLVHPRRVSAESV